MYQGYFMSDDECSALKSHKIHFEHFFNQKQFLHERLLHFKYLVTSRTGMRTPRPINTDTFQYLPVKCVGLLHYCDIDQQSQQRYKESIQEKPTFFNSIQLILEVLYCVASQIHVTNIFVLAVKFNYLGIPISPQLKFEGVDPDLLQKQGQSHF